MLCMDVFKKMKCFRVFEPSLAILGFLIVAGCVAFSFFLLDYRAVIKGSKLLGQSERLLWLKLDEASGEKVIRKVDFLSQEGGKCNVFEGDWVWDDSYPLYQSKDCSLLDEGFRCNENGRPDSFYTKWRWQPKDCNLPRFDAKIMLEKLRNKRMVFVGDSIGRNQWESLLCMLSSVIPDKKTVYEVFGNPITKHKGFLIFKFKDYNCTVEYYRSTFLVVQGRPPAGVSSNAKTTLRLDQMDWTSWKWRDADFIVFNTGHWWNYEKTIRMGCYFQEGLEVKMEMDVNTAYERSLQTVVDWAHRELNTSKTQVFFRTYAPVHFRGGDWNTGGHCHLETLPELTTSLVPSETWDRYNTLANVLLAHANSSSQKAMELLNVTHMTSRRKDGHSSLYYLGPKSPAALNRQDCSHWCLPGVPDTWNELLYALILKQENVQRDNLTDIHPA